MEHVFFFQWISRSSSLSMKQNSIVELIVESMFVTVNVSRITPDTISSFTVDNRSPGLGLLDYLYCNRLCYPDSAETPRTVDSPVWSLCRTGSSHRHCDSANKRTVLVAPFNKAVRSGSGQYRTFHRKQNLDDHKRSRNFKNL